MIKKLFIIFFTIIVTSATCYLEINKFPPKKEIKVVSYNIHSGLNKDCFLHYLI
ncbi:hypothetical protein H477_3113 [[Clostridium] sordellii ATCC 9714]|nr:hypothetical protein H477_3113 [[Clostridium] sordellii ATCC 9714] [Paeniclostridium sordellii ATCC 9714]